LLFNSLTFVVFFAVVLSGVLDDASWEARKNLLLVASYIFYGAWNPPFAALLFATTALDFYLGRRRWGAFRENPARTPSLAGHQRGGEPEHARVFQVREFSPRKFPMGPGPRWHRL
jgi:hypothetical protein